MAAPDERLPSSDAGLVRFVNANSRLKEAWDLQLVSCILLSTVIHAGVFVGLRSWRLEYGYDEIEEPEPTVFVMLPYEEGEAFPGSEVLIGADSVAVAEAEPEAEPETDATAALGNSDPLGNAPVGLEGAPFGSDGDIAALRDAFGDRFQRGRLRGPAIAVPMVAPPEPEPAADVDDSGGDDERIIDAEPSAAELGELPEPDSLSLDRLSALRPELAFMTASAWVLIRNQAEVETFLRRSYRDGTLDPTASGSVSVTLWIDRRGSVEWAEVSKSSGRTDLDEFTLALFNEVASFRAARDRGVYTSRSVTFSVNYPW